MSDERLPVIFNIHGGGFVESPSADMADVINSEQESLAKKAEAAISE